MVSPRRFDRLMNRCPVVDCDDFDAYPLASEGELVWMERELDWYARDGRLKISVGQMNRLCHDIMRYFPQWNFHEYEAYNAIGTTPAEILGFDMPGKLFRILNQTVFTRYFLKKEDLERSIIIYTYFSQYIGDRISLGQRVYLESLYKRGFGPHRLNWKVFRNLSPLNQSMSYCWQVIDMLSGMMDVFDYYGFELP